MTAAAFDTLKATKTLIAAGVDPRQAEAHAETLRDAVSEGVATKTDIANPTLPTRREFCRFSFFSATQVIDLLMPCP